VNDPTKDAGSRHWFTTTLVAEIVTIFVGVPAIAAFTGWTFAKCKDHWPETLVFIVALFATLALFDIVRKHFSENKPHSWKYKALLVLMLLIDALLLFLPARWPNPPVESDITTVNICGSTTVAENIMTRYIVLSCFRNRATTVNVNEKSNGKTQIDADFPRENTTAPDISFRTKPHIRFVIDAQGTTDGLRKVLNNPAVYQLCMASSDIVRIKDDEISKRGSELKAGLLGQDAIAIIVPTGSPVKSVTPYDLNAAFNAQGTKPNGITTFVRTQSGTTSELIEYLWEKAKFQSKELSGTLVKTNMEMLERVATTPNSIGYIGYQFAALRGDVSVVPIVEIKGKIDSAPSLASIVHRRCALIRSLFLYSGNKSSNINPSEAIAQTLVENVSTEFGGGVARMSGVLSYQDAKSLLESLTSKTESQNLADLTRKYALHYTTLTPTYMVRFPYNSLSLFPEKEEELKQWAEKEHMHESEYGVKETWVCIGGSDIHGSRAVNLGYGLLRAANVMDVLTGAGLDVIHASVGPDNPRGLDDDNRRVEIFPLTIFNAK
jgi:ABC-type phosphate transport system substrate-binding protein